MHFTKAALMTLTIFTSAGQAHAKEAEGTLDKDLIRRVVRAHIPEIRACYNQALARDPAAHGKIVVDFTIGTEGKVTAAELASSDLGDPQAAECMRAAITGWLFPKPDGGYVVVSYPFVLEPG